MYVAHVYLACLLHTNFLCCPYKENPFINEVNFFFIYLLLSTSCILCNWVLRPTFRSARVEEKNDVKQKLFHILSKRKKKQFSIYKNFTFYASHKKKASHQTIHYIHLTSQQQKISSFILCSLSSYLSQLTETYDSVLVFKKKNIFFFSF